MQSSLQKLLSVSLHQRSTKSLLICLLRRFAFMCSNRVPAADVLADFPGKMVNGVAVDEQPAPYEVDGFLEDGVFETQVLDLCEETQLVNFECETQVVDSEEGLENVQTQVLDQFEVVADSGNEDEDQGEGTSGSETEVIGLDSDELSDDNTVGKRRSRLCNVLEMGDNHNSTSTEKKDQSDISDDWPSISGSVRRGFTYVRSASMRASGLAARTLNMRDRESCSLPSNEYSPAKVVENASVQEGVHCPVGNTNLNGMKCKVGFSAVRKLFSEQQDLDRKSNGPDEAPEWKVSSLGEDTLAGLCYVDSQEPGDLSQEKALEFVDQFLKDNVKESPIKIGTSMTSRQKPLPISSRKGQHILARNAKMVSPGETLVFNWDDSRENEGGGDLFCRRREEFFHGGSILKLPMTDPINQKRGRLGVVGDKAEPSTVPCKRNRISNINLRTKLFRDTGSDKTSKKDIGNRCSEHFNANSSGGHQEPAVDDATARNMPQVGPDTQLAAEAMEELCMGGVLVENSRDDGLRNLPRKVKKRGQKQTFDYVVSGTTGHVVERQKRRVNGGSPIKRSSISQKKSPKRWKETQCSEINSVEARKAVLGIVARENIQSIVSDHRKQNISTEQVAEEGGAALLKGDGVFLSVARRTRSSLAPKEVLQYESPQNVLKTDTCVSSKSVYKRKRTARVGNKKQRRDDTCKGVEKDQNSFEVASDECVELSNARRSSTSAGSGNASVTLVNSPGIKSKGCIPATVTPDNSAKSPKSVSPLCAGDEYLKQSCRKNLCTSSLTKEISSLTSSASDASPESKSLRRRRDMTDVCVLFSQHLDDDTVKHQKKILARLGASVASSIAEATHFVTDEFVRTRNMLEAIASGKPVVTQSWLESCGQACCFLDERNYILRDTKKEKLFGFSMPSSLAHACQHPLLQGKKVLITPNTKPVKEVISKLVKAVHGQPIERIGRSGLKDGQVPDDLLILSCMDDYETCLPFLEKGAPIYSSELLLNGIVTQKLECERHRLFADHVRRTRSTTWVKKGGKNFVPLTKM